MRKNYPALKHVLLITAFFTITVQSIFAQQRSPHRIDGTVSNEKGEPLEGVVINVKNSTESVATDASGKFSISITKPDATLQSLTPDTPKKKWQSMKSQII